MCVMRSSLTATSSQHEGAMEDQAKSRTQAKRPLRGVLSVPMAAFALGGGTHESYLSPFYEAHPNIIL